MPAYGAAMVRAQPKAAATAAPSAALAALAAGTLPLRDVAGLTAAEIRGVEQQAVTAFRDNHHLQAHKLFELLELLEPDKPAHALHRAHAAASLGDVDAAVAALGRFLAQRKGETPDNIARALLFRARLLAETQPEQAAKDQAEVKALSGNPKVAALLKVTP